MKPWSQKVECCFVVTVRFDVRERPGAQARGAYFERMEHMVCIRAQFTSFAILAFETANSTKFHCLALCSEKKIIRDLANAMADGKIDGMFTNNGANYQVEYMQFPILDSFFANLGRHSNRLCERPRATRATQRGCPTTWRIRRNHRGNRKSGKRCHREQCKYNLPGGRLCRCRPGIKGHRKSGKWCHRQRYKYNLPGGILCRCRPGIVWATSTSNNEASDMCRSVSHE